MMGWNRWAFELSFYFLARDDIPLSQLFDYAQKETLRLGGDSDTNCCIVGGLIGAATGLSLIDPQKIAKVVNCDTSTGVKRPDFINPGKSDVLQMID